MSNLQDVERTLYRQGYQLARITGSHRHYCNAAGQRLTVTAHGNRLATHPAAILKDMERNAQEAVARRHQLVTVASTAAREIDEGREHLPRRGERMRPAPRPPRPRTVTSATVPRALLPFPSSSSRRPEASEIPSPTWAPWEFPVPAVLVWWMRRRSGRGKRCLFCWQDSPEWIAYNTVPADMPPPNPANASQRELLNWVRECYETHKQELPTADHTDYVCSECLINWLTELTKEEPPERLQEAIRGTNREEGPRVRNVSMWGSERGTAFLAGYGSTLETIADDFRWAFAEDRSGAA